MTAGIGIQVRRCICALLVILGVWYGVVVQRPEAVAEEKALMKGRVTDVDNRGVAGARVYVYRNSDVKKPAEYMSAPADGEGAFHMVLPQGRYWVVARSKKTDGYGPLMPGDKHSGEPVEVELAASREVVMDFVVADLKDAVRAKAKARQGYVKINGRITDENGTPARGAYATAHRNEKLSGIPDYLSAWVDDEGRYSIFVPPGKYFLGSAVTFPPGEDYLLRGDVRVDSDTSGVDIVRKSRSGK